MDSTIKRFNLKPNWGNWGIFIFFCILSVIGILHHEMWRDELQAWMVARDASNFFQLFKNLKYEGNPALWHIFLFILTRFTDSPYSIQILHLLISFSFVFIFLTQSKFNILNKFLFVTGYFILFEYNMISRGYGLGILLLFIIISLLKRKTQNHFLIFVLSALLANTTIYGLIISGAIIFTLLFNQFFPVKQPNINNNNNTKKKLRKTKKINPSFKWQWPKLSYLTYAGFTIYIWGAIFSIIQIYPEADNSFPVTIPESMFSIERFKLMAPDLMSSFIPIPNFNSLHFWNLNYINWNNFENTHQLFLLLLITFTIVFLKNRNALIFYTVGTLVLLFIFYYSGLTWWRYTGHLYIVLISAYWIKNIFPDREFQKIWLKKLSAIGKKISVPLLTILLTVHSIGGIIAFSKDLKLTFAAGEKSADFLKAQKLTNLPIIGNIDFLISPISGFINKPIYYPSRQESGSFIIWDNLRVNDPSLNEIIKHTESGILKENDSLLLILSTPVRDANTNKEYTVGSFNKNISFKLLKSFDDSIIIENEDHHIYLID